MEKKDSALVLLLLLLLIDEFAVQTEARTCFTKSKKFHGRCFFRHQISNCKAICKHEKFTTGRCSLGACLCVGKCNGGSGGGGAARPPPPPIPGGEEGGEEGRGRQGGEEGGKGLF